MSLSTAGLWALIGAMALVTYVSRSAFFLLPPGVRTPALLQRALRYVPAAVLTTIWIPELLLRNGALYLSAGNERLLAGTLAVLVAWRWRNTFATIFAGLAGLHAFGWLVH